MSKSRNLIGMATAVLILGACSNGAGTDETSPTSTTVSTTTSTTASPTTSTTETIRGLDLSGARWVTHGLDGIRLDDGTLIWETQPFPAGVARDRQGGLAFTDSTGLWWFQAGAAEPQHVGGGAAEVLAVATAKAGPVAVVWGAGPSFVNLSDGNPVESPPAVPVEISSEPPWLIWTAANGLSAWVTEPEVERDSEGQPSQVLKPAHLIVARDEEVLVDLRIGGVYDAWATIHDFDGRTLIISRGPYEPAMPEETFLVIDLAEGAVTGWFEAGGTRATLAGADVEWDGPVLTPDLGSLTPSPITTDEGITSLDDGRYLAFIIGSRNDNANLEIDLAVWFSGSEANTAATIDGETDIPVPNDYYIRNADPTILSIPVAAGVEVTSVWYDYDTDPDLENDPISYLDLLDVINSDGEGIKGNMRTDPWWVTFNNGEIVALDEQYIP